ncbi:FecR family protein, partial [Verrucomicrobiales bacterium]|nr:FecR family protein [Verrucomicrobiales bacterium]
MSQSQKDLILELANGYIERALSREEMAEFEALLEESNGNRAVYLDYMETHSLLQQRQMGESVQDDIDAFEEEYRPRRFPSPWQTFAALAIISLLALVLVRPPTPDGTFAEMTKTESARWESSTLPTSEGARLRSGQLKLIRGLATIAFDSGAEVILEAPATLDLVDAMNCVLSEGTAVAEVSESAQGFMIKTPTADVIDHGTRFAVNVDQ